MSKFNDDFDGELTPTMIKNWTKRAEEEGNLIRKPGSGRKGLGSVSDVNHH